MSEEKAEYKTGDIEQAKKDTAIITRLSAIFEASNDTVGVPKIFVDICGDIFAAMVLDELFFWTLPKKKTGKTSLRVRKDGVLWLAVRRQDWWERKRLTERQSDCAIQKLLDLDFIEKEVYKYNGKPTIHLRLKMMNFINPYVLKLSEIMEDEDEDNNSIKTDISDLYAMMGFPISRNGNPISRNGEGTSRNRNMINSIHTTSTKESDDEIFLKPTPSEEALITSKQLSRREKKGDLVDGILFYASQAKEQGIDQIENTLVGLERGLKRNIPRHATWQDLAKWINKRPHEPFQRWISWYMKDNFNAKNAWRLNPEQIRNSWPSAFVEENISSKAHLL